MNPITPNDLLKLVKDLMEFPNPLICRHFVAANLLSLLESKGYPITNELAKAVIDADDATAIALLAKI